MKLSRGGYGFICVICINLWILIFLIQEAECSTCSTVLHIGWERHSSDCTLYYMCHLGKKMGRTRKCPKDEVWSDTKARCVSLTSKYNDCACNGKTSFSRCVQSPCTGLFLIEYRPDFKSCHSYHVCYRGVTVNILQCPTGTLWDNTEGRCTRHSHCKNKSEKTTPSPIYKPSSPQKTTPSPIYTPSSPQKTTPSPIYTPSPPQKILTTTPKTRSTKMTTMHTTSKPETTVTPTLTQTHTPVVTTTEAPSTSQVNQLFPDCGIIATPYIVGGTPAFEGEWPWQILLKGRINGTHETQCGGVLVDKRWVMTAAHCVFRTALHEPDAWTIVLGEHATTYSSGREKVVRPRKIIRHMGYEPRGGFPDDIALMELPDGVSLEKFIMPVCLPPKDFVIPEGSPCWITGWGNTDAQGHGSEVLNSLSVSVWSQRQCQMAWGEHISRQHICVGTGDTGACAGDSGGPLSCEVDGRFVVAGIASWGVPGCRTPGYPDVYTNVTSYLTWIEGQLGSKWNPG